VRRAALALVEVEVVTADEEEGDETSSPLEIAKSPTSGTGNGPGGSKLTVRPLLSES